MLDQVEQGRRAGLGQLPRRRHPRRAALLGDLDDDAVGAPRVQERLFPVRVGQVDLDGLDAESPDPGQRGLDVGDDEVEVVRAGAAGGQEALQEGRVGAAGGRHQLDFRSRGELQLAPPEAGGVAAVEPCSAEDAAEQLPAVGQGRRADGKMIENDGHYGLTLRSEASTAGHDEATARVPGSARAPRSRGTRRRALMRPLVLRPLVNRQVNAVTEGVGGLVRQRLLQVPEHDADEEVLLARPGPEAAGG